MDNSSPTPPTKMRFLVFGAGAIGTYIGGSLALRDHAVVFIERPDIAEIVRQNGVHLRLPGGAFQVSNPVLVASLPDALATGPFDAAIFALKSFDTGSAAGQLAPYARDLPPVLCLSNGVENEPTLAKVLGDKGVIAGTVTSAIGRGGPGDIQLEKLRGVGIHAGHPLSTRLEAAFNEAGLNARLYADSAAMKWSKMLTNLLANATSAILDMTPAEIFAHPGLYRLELAQLREVLAVMAAMHTPVVDLPSTPVRALAFAVRWLPADISRPLLKKAVGGGRGAKMPSFHIDLHAGRGLSEVDYLNGAVIRSGIEYGIATPVNKVLNETLLALTNKAIALDEYARQPEKLIRAAGR